MGVAHHNLTKLFKHIYILKNKTRTPNGFFSSIYIIIDIQWVMKNFYVHPVLDIFIFCWFRVDNIRKKNPQN